MELTPGQKKKLGWISVGVGAGVGFLGVLYPLGQWIVWKTNEEAAAKVDSESLKGYFLGSMASLVVAAILAAVAVVGVRYFLKKKWEKSNILKNAQYYDENVPINI